MTTDLTEKRMDQLDTLAHGMASDFVRTARQELSAKETTYLVVQMSDALYKMALDRQDASS